MDCVDILIYRMIGPEMIESTISILTVIFTGIVTSLTIVSAVVSFINKDRDKKILKQIKNFDKYTDLLTGKEKRRQVDDRYIALRNIYLKYEVEYNKIKNFDKLLDSFETVFKIGGTVACVLLLMALVIVHIWWVLGLAIFCGIASFAYKFVNFVVGLLETYRLSNNYPAPNELLNPLNALDEKSMIISKVDEDLIQNIFFYGLAMRIHNMNNVAVSQDTEKDCTQYLSIYSFLPYSIKEVIIICFYENGKRYKEKILNFSEKTNREKAIVNCVIHSQGCCENELIKIEVRIENGNGVAITHEYKKIKETKDNCYYPTGLTITESTCFETELDQGFASSERVI